jgi:hypothetical protein
MSIIKLVILPPLAIARLGSSPTPLDNYELEVPDGGLDFRRIVPAETLHIDDASGEITDARPPKTIRFRDGDQIRPVAPFLEVFARTSDGAFKPLTLDLLHASGLAPKDVRWTVEVGNIKAFRRTGQDGDKAIAKVGFSDHAVHALDATAPSFIPGKVLPLGTVRYIRPSPRFPEIRLRFTPAKGLVYGASAQRKELDRNGNEVRKDDEVVAGRVIYDGANAQQKWLDWVDTGDANTTNPGAIFGGFDDKDGNHVSWGYLDDECDGLVTVELRTQPGTTLSAFARIGAGPPNFAPDGLPIRTVHDELMQALLGPQVADADVSPAEAEDIVRRAFETVRLMNTTVMNGNTVAGRTAVASMMPSQDSNDTHRLFAPVMASSIVDNRSVLALHHGVLAALRAGAAPWFVDVLRKPEEIGDLSDAGRRKMPAMMRGADARYLTLTRRQIDMISQVAAAAPFAGAAPKAVAHNLTAQRAQLAYRGRGNPPVSHPMSAISNCFPGLEFDFRNIWRRIFVGIVLTEHSNFVAGVEDPKYDDLKGRRLLAIDGRPVMTQAKGPAIPGRGQSALPIDGNLQAVAFMEWSNTIALIWNKQGQQVSCVFTEEESEGEVLYNKDDKTLKTKVRELEVRHIFEQVQVDGRPEGRAVLARALAEPGELTQGLCSPWQNDYRECACYYWAASRPDYVNVLPTDDGATRGDMWLQTTRTGDYILDNRRDERLVTYDDLFTRWEKVLKFAIRGKDADASDEHK